MVPIAQVQAQDRPTRLNVWDIHISEAASGIPEGFINYACGTNGGPPSVPLANFTESKKCRPDANGLHEVYFEYDDELEYWARALDLKPEIRMYAGTTAYEFPVVASVLFDEAGLVKGMRLVTDPRQQLSRDRSEFWTLANFIRQRFGDDGWECKDLPPEEGEHPVGSVFIKNHCEKMAKGLHLVLEQSYFQKKGPAIGRSRLWKAPDARLSERDPFRDVRCGAAAAEDQRELTPLAHCPIVPSTRRAPFVLIPSVMASSRSACCRREPRKSPLVRSEPERSAS